MVKFKRVMFYVIRLMAIALLITAIWYFSSSKEIYLNLDNVTQVELVDDNNNVVLDTTLDKYFPLRIVLSGNEKEMHLHTDVSHVVYSVEAPFTIYRYRIISSSSDSTYAIYQESQSFFRPIFQ